MHLPLLACGLSLVLSAGGLLGQTNHPRVLLIPFLDPDSQSNVVVRVSDLFGAGETCPPEYTNSLSNRKLFTPAEQRLIAGLFVKYRDVTPSHGPAGTVVSNYYKTNWVTKTASGSFRDEGWVADFQYTNLNAHEKITVGLGMRAEFRNRSNDGYTVSLSRTGGGTTLLNYGEIRQGLPHGLFARFADLHEQGSAWDYRLASFTNSPLVEYRRRTNGLTVGKFLMWNPLNGNLIIEAEFKEPFDFELHRADLRAERRH